MGSALPDSFSLEAEFLTDAEVKPLCNVPDASCLPQGTPRLTSPTVNSIRPLGPEVMKRSFREELWFSCLLLCVCFSVTFVAATHENKNQMESLRQGKGLPFPVRQD